MSEVKQIKEEDKVQEEWYTESRHMTVENLPKFFQKLTEQYGHDYGTICHAMAAGALATMRAMDKTPQGGITGFQAGAIMWEFIKRWMYESNKTSFLPISFSVTVSHLFSRSTSNSR